MERERVGRIEGEKTESLRVVPVRAPVVCGGGTEIFKCVDQTVMTGKAKIPRDETNFTYNFTVLDLSNDNVYMKDNIMLQIFDGRMF